MSNKLRIVLAALLMTAATTGADVFGQERPPARVSGTIDDYVWVEVGAGAGAWHVTGEWTARVKVNDDRADFIASLLGVRSDLWVQMTGADPANPALRTPHTHHVRLHDAVLSPISNGFRLTGPAIITSNGTVAPFSGSTVQVDLTGGSSIGLSNIKLTFLDDATEHFGPQPYEGLVVLGR